MKNLYLAAFIALALLAGSVSAQQREPNATGGALKSAGQDPTPGMPFLVPPTSNVEFDVEGNANAGYALVVGQLATTSITSPALSGQFFDLDLSTAQVVGDAIGGVANGLPLSLFILNSLGKSHWSIPVNSGLAGQSIAFQSVVYDTSLPPLNLNITAAAEFSIQNVTLLTGDDATSNVILSQGFSLYGQTYTQCWVSTNGWIKFGNTAPTFGDLSESTADFMSGNLGGSGANTGPAIAVLWDDLDMGNGSPNQQVIISEAASGILRVTWQNGDYYPSTPFGTVVCTIDVTQTTPQVTMDYMGYTASPTPTEGIVGISDGGVASATSNEIDLVQSGAVVPAGGVNTAETLFQNFDTGAFSEMVDLSGLVLHFVDASGSGQFTLF